MTRIAPTTPEEAAAIAELLDFATLETERLVGADPMDSLRDSQTVWDGDLPMCSFGFSPPEGMRPAHAWLMVTRHVGERGFVRELIRLMRKHLREGVARYGRIEGVAWIKGDAPRMLAMLGATFELPRHPSFLRWELHDNAKLWRVA